MKIALTVLGTIVVLALAVVLIGWSLPVKHQATRERTFPVTPAAVFATITNVETFPTWRSKVDRVEIVSASSFREIGDDGSILYVVEEAVPDQKLVTRIADPSLPFGGTWTYALAPSGSGATLRITEDGEVYNPIFRFVSRFVFGHTATIDGYLEDLSIRLAAPR